MIDDVNGCIHVAMIDLCSSRCGFKNESDVMSTVHSRCAPQLPKASLRQDHRTKRAR